MLWQSQKHSKNVISAHIKTTNPGNLSKHTTNVRKEKYKSPKECHDCGKVFSCKDTLERHVKIHQKDNSQESCKNCDSNFATSDDLELHVKTVH